MTEELEAIPLDEIFVDMTDFNCRGAITPFDVLELAKDIRSNGLTQPVTVRPWDRTPGKKYHLIAGYRRYESHRVNSVHKDCPQNAEGKPTIKAIVKHNVSDDQAVAMNLSENIQRKDLTLLQESRAIERLKMHGWTGQEVGEKIGKSYGWVQTRFMFLELPPDIQIEIVRCDLPHAVVRDLWTQPDLETRYDLLRKIKDAKMLGKKRPINPLKLVKNKPNSKRVRERGEIEQLQDTIRENLGNNLATKVLGWVLGMTDDLDVHQKIREDGLNGTFGKKTFYIVPNSLLKPTTISFKDLVRKNPVGRQQ